MTNNLDESAAQVVAAVQSGKLTQAAADNLRTWLTQPQYAAYFPRLSQLIAGDSWSILQDSFWERIPFGTAGRRGPMGELGTATMNERTIAESAHGVAVHVKQSLPTEWHRAVIGHDTRNRSQEFARITASVFAAHGIKTFLFPSHRSTPELSFAVRQLKCGTGVMITASHNPPADNGFKVYSQTGGQVLDDEATRITAAVNSAVNIPTVDLLTSLRDGRVELVGEEIDSPFIRGHRPLTVGSARRHRSLQPLSRRRRDFGLSSSSRSRFHAGQDSSVSTLAGRQFPVCSRPLSEP